MLYSRSVFVILCPHLVFDRKFIYKIQLKLLETLFGAFKLDSKLWVTWVFPVWWKQLSQLSYIFPM